MRLCHEPRVRPRLAHAQAGERMKYDQENYEDALRGAAGRAKQQGQEVAEQAREQGQGVAEKVTHKAEVRGQGRARGLGRAGRGSQGARARAGPMVKGGALARGACMPTCLHAIALEAAARACRAPPTSLARLHTAHQAHATPRATARARAGRGEPRGRARHRHC